MTTATYACAARQFTVLEVRNLDEEQVNHHLNVLEAEFPAVIVQKKPAEELRWDVLSVHEWDTPGQANVLMQLRTSGLTHVELEFV